MWFSGVGRKMSVHVYCTTLRIQSCTVVALVSVTSHLCPTSTCLPLGAPFCLCDPWAPQAEAGTLWICMILDEDVALTAC